MIHILYTSTHLVSYRLVDEIAEDAEWCLWALSIALSGPVARVAMRSRRRGGTEMPSR